MKATKFFKNSIYISIAILFALILTASFSMEVHAAPSWVRAGEAGVYGNTGISAGTQVDNGEDEEQDSIIKHARKFILYIEDDIGNNESTNGVADLTMDGIVFGRLAGYDVSIGKFELYEGNPYGIVGAYGYRLFRNVIYGLVFLYFLVLMLNQLIGGGAKKRAELKDTVYNIVFIFFMLNFMPVFVNLFTVLRDELIAFLAQSWGIQNFSGLDGVFAGIHGSPDDRTFTTELLALGYKIAPFFYMGSYLSNSLLATGFFILFPVVLLRSLKNKSLFGAWCGNFFSYLAFPLIDFVFLSIPLLMKSLLSAAGMGGSFSDSFTYMVITVLCVWAVIPTRNGLMRFIGTTIGVAPSNGFGALAGMAMLAMRGMGGGRSGSSGGGGKEGVLSDLANANKYDALAANMDSSITEAVNAANGIDGLDTLFKKDGDAVPQITAVMGDDTANLDATASAKAAEDSEEMAGAFAGMVGEDMDINTPAQDMADVEEVNSFDNSAASSMDDMPLTAEGTPLVEDTNEYSELVMPDSENQRELLENRRLENLDRMDTAQKVWDEQQKLIGGYDTQIAELERQDAQYKQTIDTLAGTTSDRQTQISALEKSISADKVALGGKTQGTSEYNVIQSRIDSNTHKLEQLNSEQTTEMASLEKAKKAYNPYETQTQIASLREQQKVASELQKKAGVQISQRQTQEANYANIERMYGGDGKTFTSKNQYAESVRNKEIEKRSMTYRNFDSSANLSMLSPQEKAEFHRKRAKATMVKKTISAATSAITTAAGAGAMLYGGPQATMMGAAGGYMLGSGATKKVVSIGEDANDLRNSRKIKNTSREYNNQDVAVRGERVFKPGGKYKVVNVNEVSSTQKTVQPSQQAPQKTVVEKASERVIIGQEE